ncbi:site-specific integrase [Vibrio parahaemolyticus]
MRKKEIDSLIDSYCGYLKHKDILEKTIYDIRNKLGRIMSIVDKDINKWTKKDALEIYYGIHELPAYLMHNKKYKGMATKEILEVVRGTNYRRISSETVKKYLNTIKSFYKWVIGFGYAKVDIFENINVAKSKVKDNERRKAYSEKDLKLIFNDEIFHDSKHSGSFRYWIVIIAALLGMRQSEISQLYKSNIKVINGFWCIAVEAKFKDQRIKNRKSIRLIPIPNELIRLGFLDFVSSCEEGPIFKDINRCNKDGYGRDVSRWFSKTKDKLGFCNKYTFHSFRHYFINNLKQKGVDLAIVSEITGHTYNSVAFENYGKDYSLKEKKKIIDKYSSETIRSLPRTYPKTRKNKYRLRDGFLSCLICLVDLDKFKAFSF